MIKICSYFLIIESNEVTVVYFSKNYSDNKSNKKEKKTLNSNLINVSYDLSNFNDKLITFLEVSYIFNNNFIFANIDIRIIKKKLHLKIQFLF